MTSYLVALLNLDTNKATGADGISESLGNTTATSVKTCSITIAFLLEDKGDHKL